MYKFLDLPELFGTIITQTPPYSYCLFHSNVYRTRTTGHTNIHTAAA